MIPSLRFMAAFLPVAGSSNSSNSSRPYAANSGKTFGVVTTVGLVLGALGHGTATCLFLSAPAAESPRSSAYLVGIRAKW